MFSRGLVAALALILLNGCATTKNTLFLARHGQTPWNRVSRFQGDPDLDPIGYINRVSLWTLMQKEPLAHIFTSKLQRTQRTAALVAQEHGLPLRERAALNEIGSGILTGICRLHMEPTYHKKSAGKCLVSAKGVRINTSLGVIQKAWAGARRGGLSGRVPLGESYFDMVKRARPFIPELMSALDDGKVLMVGHGLINRVYLSLLMGWPMAHVKHLRQENDQVYRFEGLGSDTPQVSLYTPGFGWKRCTAPKQGQKRLDCNPGPAKGLHGLGKGLGASRHGSAGAAGSSEEVPSPASKPSALSELASPAPPAALSGAAVENHSNKTTGASSKSSDLPTPASDSP